MESVFLKVVNLSITASWLVLAVVVLRLVLKKAPKWIFCLLWGMVALRLLCPFTLESSLSMIPNSQPLPPDILYSAQQQAGTGIEPVDEVVNPALPNSLSPSPGASANPTPTWSSLLAGIWLTGMAGMLLYTLASYLLLKHRMATATPLRKGIKQSELVESPFVLGLFRPIIYLPYHLDETDQLYVIAHEEAHIRRRDHWWKPLGFLLLSVYWFNPVLWVAYILLCRDIEAACDEKVIKDIGLEGRQAYSTALLNLSIHRRRIAACPLAFGEVGVKERVISVMSYKKPGFWIILAALIGCIAVAVGFLTNPIQAFTFQPGLYTGTQILYYHPYEIETEAPPYLQWYVDEENRFYALSAGEYAPISWDFQGVFQDGESLEAYTILADENLWRDSKPKDATHVLTSKAFFDIFPVVLFRTKDNQLYCAEFKTVTESGDPDTKELELHSVWKLQWEACSELPISKDDQSRSPDEVWNLIDSIVISPPTAERNPSFTITYPEELITEDFYCWIYAYDSDRKPVTLYKTPSFGEPSDLTTVQTFTDFIQYESVVARFAYIQDGSRLAWKEEVVYPSQWVSGKKLTMDEVILLSRKGTDLSWQDFEGFEHEEIGFGLYICRYPINEDYALYIGGSNTDTQPMYIRLSGAQDTDTWIDIRTENVQAFLDGNLRQPAAGIYDAQEILYTTVADVLENRPVTNLFSFKINDSSVAGRQLSYRVGDERWQYLGFAEPYDLTNAQLDAYTAREQGWVGEKIASPIASAWSVTPETGTTYLVFTTEDQQIYGAVMTTTESSGPRIYYLAHMAPEAAMTWPNMVASDITPEGLVLRFLLSSGNSRQFYVLPGTSLAKKEGDSWITLIQAPEDAPIGEALESVQSFREGKGTYVDWPELGSLSPGEYRLGKWVSTQQETAKGEVTQIYAFFAID